MENKMEKVAKLLGLELEEEFVVKDYDNTHKLNNTYKLTNDGLVRWSNVNQEWVDSGIFNDLLTGDVKITKLSSESILTEKEKERKRVSISCY